MSAEIKGFAETFFKNTHPQKIKKTMQTGRQSIAVKST